jgi:hypothetical protein
MGLWLKGEMDYQLGKARKGSIRPERTPTAIKKAKGGPLSNVQGRLWRQQQQEQPEEQQEERTDSASFGRRNYQSVPCTAFGPTAIPAGGLDVSTLPDSTSESLSARW